jgi:hypothetical protein
MNFPDETSARLVKSCRLFLKLQSCPPFLTLTFAVTLTVYLVVVPLSAFVSAEAERLREMLGIDDLF